MTFKKMYGNLKTVCIQCLQQISWKLLINAENVSHLCQMCFNVTSMNKTFLIERTLLLLLNFYIVDTFPSILDIMFVFRKKIYSFFFF